MANKFFFSAGEASGDLHAAQVVKELRTLVPEAQFTFLGGDLMAAEAGVAPLIHYRDMAFMGFSEVIRNLGKVARNLRRAKEAISRQRPDAVVLVDYPSFNLKLAKHAHSLGIPVYYYIAPKVWAWKEWRIRDLKRHCTKILSILPFEVAYFKKRGVEVEYVGNPSVAEVEAKLARLPGVENFVERHGLDPSRPILALVPGSRLAEIRNNLPLMAEAAERFPQLQPVIAGAPAVEKEFYRQFSRLPMVTDQTFELMNAASCALVTSGTATLECALLGTPQAVCYRGNGTKLTYKIMERVLRCPFISLPNLVANRQVVPELLMYRCTADSMAAELEHILPGSPGRETMLKGYADIRSALGPRAPLRSAAEIVAASLEKP